MPKKKFLIAMDEDLHKKLKCYAKEGETALGDAIGLLVHHAENRVDLAILKNDLPYKERKTSIPKGRFSSMLYIAHEFTNRDQMEIYRIEDERELEKIPRPFMSFGKRVEDCA